MTLVMKAFWKAIITASSHTQFSHPGAQTANLLGKRGWPPTREFDRPAENQLLRKFPLPVHSCPSTPASSHSALPPGVVIPLQPPCQSFRDISANLVLLSSLRTLSRPFAHEPVRWAPPFVCWRSLPCALDQTSILHPNFVPHGVTVPPVLKFTITNKTRKKNFDE